MESSTSRRVMETVWPWKTRAAEGSAAPSGRPAWMRGGIQALITAGIGFVLYRYAGHAGMAYVVWTIALVVAVSSICIHRVFEAIEGFGRRLGVWVGTGLTWGLLVPFFYLVFVPGRIVLWLLGKDPMNRRFPAKEASCWSPRRTKMDERHYRKQFS